MEKPCLSYNPRRRPKFRGCHFPPVENASKAQIPMPSEILAMAADLVFCCFNSVFKIMPEVFAAWMRILQSVPGSVLWLHENEETAIWNLRREANAAGVSPERLIFAPKLPTSDHLARYRLADLVLDTSPFNGHTTTSDALWVGVPVITIIGQTFASRVAASLLTTVGLAELITTNLIGYSNLAISLAGDPTRLAMLKQKLSDSRLTTPLFDTVRYVRDLEAALLSCVSRTHEGFEEVTR